MMAEKELRLRKSSQRLLNKTARAAAKAYENGTPLEAYFAAARFEGEWYRTLVAHYTITAKAFGKYTQAQIGVDSQRSFTEILTDFIQNEGLKKSRQISKTSIELVKTVILDGAEEGLGPREIAREIRKQVGGVQARARSDMIARTETHNAATFAQHSMAESVGLDLDKEWVTSIDGRERESHRDADGQTVSLHQKYFVDGEELDRPGEGSAGNAINCRCSEIFHPRT
jgi:Uncharacterized protein, homolog of phage Mu protein gp30